jgi:prepilin-type N-terminal cleavage/methylation domain-containing protein
MKKQTLKKFVGKQAASRVSIPRSTGFTLVEILVVLAIIALLAALLFPAFKGMQERGRQTNCAANLKQIGIAVQQYYQDEKFYPSSLAVLMPQDIDMTGDGVSNSAAPENSGGAAYLPNVDVALCQDDDTEATAPRFSYGPYGVNNPTALGAPFTVAAGTPPADPGQYVWNYWGYRADGYAYQSAQEAGEANNTSPYTYLAYKSAPYNHPQAVTAPLSFNPNAPRNVVEHSLSNRYAPKSTIITHCVYHRLPTANNLNQHSELYYTPATDPTAGQGAKDIILILSGEAKTLDVSSEGVAGGKWQTHKF